MPCIVSGVSNKLEWERWNSRVTPQLPEGQVRPDEAAFQQQCFSQIPARWIGNNKQFVFDSGLDVKVTSRGQSLALITDILRGRDQ